MDDARRRVTVVLDPDVSDAVERQAEAERGSKSGVCRRVLSEWAKSIAAEAGPRMVAALCLAAALLAVCAVSAGA